MKSLRFFCLFILWIVSCYGKEPTALYLTWTKDPSSSMTVCWFTTNEDSPRSVHYRKQGDILWEERHGKTTDLGHKTYTHYAEITHLEPDTRYEFYLTSSEKKYQFSTLSNDLSVKGIRCVIGGDLYLNKDKFIKMNKVVANLQPDFVILGGDIAYTEGLRTLFRNKYWKIRKWLSFFQIWKSQMVTPDGRLIPMVPVIGNHDVREGINPLVEPELYYQIFPHPEKGISYRVFKIAGSICFFLLDSGHTYSIPGRQSEWLENELQNQDQCLYKIPVYHISAYPAVLSYNMRKSVEIRKNWCPLFEENDVQVAFEHHNHAYKRTCPIKNEKKDPNGVIYLGDGCWGGVNPRRTHPHWYLSRAEKINCFWLLTFTAQNCLMQALDRKARVIETLEIAP